MGAAFVATLLLICSVCAKQLSKNVELHTNLLELDPNVQSVWTQETIPTALRYYYNGTWLRMLPKSDEVSWGALNSTSTQCEVIQSVLAIVDTLLTTANNTSSWQPWQQQRYSFLLSIQNRYQQRQNKACPSSSHTQQQKQQEQHQRASKKQQQAAQLTLIPKWYHGIVGAEKVNETVFHKAVMTDSDTSIWCGPYPIDGYGPLYFAFGTDFENEADIMNSYSEDLGVIFFARAGTWRYFDDSDNLRIVSVIMQDANTTQQFFYFASLYLTQHQISLLKSITMTREEALVERAVVTLARIYSRDRANVFAEGNLGVVWTGVTKENNNNSSNNINSNNDYSNNGSNDNSYSDSDKIDDIIRVWKRVPSSLPPAPSPLLLPPKHTLSAPPAPDACWHRYCLKNANNSQQLQQLVQSMSHGDLLLFVGNQWYDEVKEMMNAPKFSLVTVNATTGQRYLTDMLFSQLSPYDKPELPTRRLMTRAISVTANQSSAGEVAALAVEGWPNWQFVANNQPNSQPWQCGPWNNRKQCYETSYSQVFGHVDLTGVTDLPDPVMLAINGAVIEKPNPAISSFGLYCSLSYKQGMCPHV